MFKGLFYFGPFCNLIQHFISEWVLAKIRNAPKRMHTLIWNFLTFYKHQKQKFWQNLNFNFLPPPPLKGVLKEWNFRKLIVEHNLQNMIFKTHKMRTKSKRWALYLQNWASYANFRVSTKGKNLVISKFTNLNISFNFWDFSPNFGMWPLYVLVNKWYIAI